MLERRQDFDRLAEEAAIQQASAAGADCFTRITQMTSEEWANPTAILIKAQEPLPTSFIELGPDSLRESEDAFVVSRSTNLSPERDAQLTAQAMQNVESFVVQLQRDAAGVAARFADIALLSGIAGSAIASSVSQGEDGVEWLALHGGKQLAEWAQSQTPVSADADFPLTLATQLDTYIRGRARADADTLTVEGAHPKIGEEVIRLLQLLHVFLRFEEALAQASQQELIAVLRLFRQELSKLTQQQPQNAYMYDYTLQEIATQSFSLALDMGGRNSPVIGALTEIRNEMKALRERPASVVEIHTSGGAFVAGDVNVTSGDFIGRDIRVTSRC